MRSNRAIASRFRSVEKVVVTKLVEMEDERYGPGMHQRRKSFEARFPYGAPASSLSSPPSFQSCPLCFFSSLDSFVNRTVFDFMASEITPPQRSAAARA